MFVFMSPQIRLDDYEIEYSFSGDIITATYKGITDVFDFTGLPEGSLPKGIDLPAPITTTLEICPIVDAYRKDGVLYVKLVKLLDDNATKEDLFPEWVVK